MHLLVSYVANHWANSLTWHVVMYVLNGSQPDKALFLTWVFGEPVNFAKILGRVAHLATVDESGVLLGANGQPLTELGLPVDVLGKILPFCLAGVTRWRFG
jgi:hypothetical protein